MKYLQLFSVQKLIVVGKNREFIITCSLAEATSTSCVAIWFAMDEFCRRRKRHFQVITCQWSRCTSHKYLLNKLPNSAEAFFWPTLWIYTNHTLGRQNYPVAPNPEQHSRHEVVGSDLLSASERTLLGCP